MVYNTSAVVYRSTLMEGWKGKFIVLASDHQPTIEFDEASSTNATQQLLDLNLPKSAYAWQTQSD